MTAALKDVTHGTILTTTISTAAIASWTVPTNTIASIVTRSVIRNTTSGLSTMSTSIGIFANVAGTVTQIGATASLEYKFDSSVLAGAPTLAVNGTAVECRANMAQGGTNVSWDTTMEVIAYTYA